jgi:hypothetical protein
MDNNKSEEIQKLCDGLGINLTLIGFGVLGSEIVYSIILFLIEMNNAIPKNVNATKRIDITNISYIMIFTAILIVPLTYYIYNKLLKSDLVGTDINCHFSKKAKCILNGNSPYIKEMLKYLRAALIASAIGGIPGIMGLVLALITMLNNGASLLEDKSNLAIIAGLLLWSLILKAKYIPTRGRLEEFLIEKESGMENLYL